MTDKISVGIVEEDFRQGIVRLRFSPNAPKSLPAFISGEIEKDHVGDMAGPFMKEVITTKCKTLLLELMHIGALQKSFWLNEWYFKEDVARKYLDEKKNGQVLRHMRIGLPKPKR